MTYIDSRQSGNDPVASVDQWRSAYDAKVRDFAKEARKTSTLTEALHALGCRAAGAHEAHCPGCLALFNVDAIDPVGGSVESGEAVR